MGAWFTWNSKDSRSMGIVVTEVPPHVYPEERVQQVHVIGRPGAVLIPEGDGIYNPYVKSIGIGNRGSVSHREIAAWLRGTGTLVLSSEPYYAYTARIISEAQVERIFPGTYSGQVDFLVQPLKAEYPPQPAITVEGSGAGSTDIKARGDVAARPKYRVEGTGTVVLTVGDASETGAGSVLSVALETGMDGFVVDTDAAMVTSLDGTENLSHLCELFYNGFRGLWLPSGDTTTVSWTGSVTSVSIDPRWRWL